MVNNKNSNIKTRTDMKKVVTAAFCLIAIAMLAVGCSDNSPEGVVKKQMECLMDKDAEGLAELIDMGGEAQEEAKAELVSMIQDKGFKSIDDKGGIKSYEVLDVDVSDNPKPGHIAFVTVKTVYTNDSEEEEKVKLVMNQDGKWKVSMSK